MNICDLTFIDFRLQHQYFKQMTYAKMIIKILMIEDDLELAQIITDYLKSFDIEVTTTDSPYNGLSMLNLSKEYARDDILDKVMGLERGADDYLPKPYNPRELQARIKTILKRVDNKLDDKKSQKDKVFELKESDMQILFKGESLVLTLAEYDILKLLIQRNHGVVSREDFIYTSDNIEDESSLKNIDVIISRIRTKLANIDNSKQYIKSVRGIGYQLI